MRKDKIITITREYDKDGNLVRETEVITETECSDNITTYPTHYYPLYQPIYVDRVYYTYPTITCKSDSANCKG